MSNRKCRTTILLLAICVTGATLAVVSQSDPKMAEAAGQGPDSKGASAGDAEIRKANADYAKAMMAADLDAIMAYWAPDADYIDEAGKITRGKDKIAALFRDALPDLKGSKVNIRVDSLKFLRPEICLEDGTVEATSAAGTKESNRFAAVWSRTGDKWLISSVRDLPTETTDLPSLASAQLKELEWLVGDWVDDSPKADVSLKISWATNRAFLLMNYVVKREGVEPLEVTVRVGWDGHNGRIRSWVFDSQGGFGEGYWTRDGKKWFVGTSGILPDGGAGGATNSYEFTDANSFIWCATDRDVDGQPLADADVKFVRATAKK